MSLRPLPRAAQCGGSMGMRHECMLLGNGSVRVDVLGHGSRTFSHAGLAKDLLKRARCSVRALPAAPLWIARAPTSSQTALTQDSVVGLGSTVSECFRVAAALQVTWRIHSYKPASWITRA